MSDLNAALGGSGAPYEIQTPGRTYYLGAIGQGVKDRFSAKVKGMARAEIVGMKADLTAAEFKRDWDDFTIKRDTGWYAFTGPACQGWAVTFEGASYLLWLMLTDEQPGMKGKGQEKMTLEEAQTLMLEHPEQVTEAFQEMNPAGKSRPSPVTTVGAA